MSESLYFVAIDHGGTEKIIYLTDASGLESINISLAKDKHLMFTSYNCEKLSDQKRVWIRNNTVRNIRIWEEQTVRKVASSESEVGNENGVRS